MKASLKKASLNRSIQLLKWQQVCELLVEGRLSKLAIADKVGISFNTVCSWASRSGPPRPIGNRGFAAGLRLSYLARRRGGANAVPDLPSDFAADPRVPELREALTSAFIRGDMTAYAGYIQKLQLLVDAARPKTRPPLDAPSFLEAAE